MIRSTESMKYHLVIWKVCGQWNWPGRPAFYPVYGAAISIFCYILFPLGMFVQIFFALDYNEAIEIGCIFFTSLAGFKLWLVMRQRPLIVRIFQIMDQLDGQLVSGEYQAIVAAGVDRAKLVNVIGCFFNYTASVWLYAVKVWPTTNTHTLIWHFYVPFEYRQSAVVFHAVLFYQFVGTLFVAMVHSSVDALGGSMYAVLGAHLDVLERRMSRLGTDDDNNDGEDILKMTQNYWKRRETLKLKKIENYVQLGKCVETHKLCVE